MRRYSPSSGRHLLAELVELGHAVAVRVLPHVLAEFLPDEEVDLLQHGRALGLRLVDRVQIDGAGERRPPVRPPQHDALVVEQPFALEGVGVFPRAVRHLRLGRVRRRRAEAGVRADGVDRGRIGERAAERELLVPPLDAGAGRERRAHPLHAGADLDERERVGDEAVGPERVLSRRSCSTSTKGMSRSCNTG